jgi:hypothetical protein
LFWFRFMAFLGKINVKSYRFCKKKILRSVSILVDYNQGPSTPEPLVKSIHCSYKTNRRFVAFCQKLFLSFSLF